MFSNINVTIFFQLCFVFHFDISTNLYLLFITIIGQFYNDKPIWKHDRSNNYINLSPTSRWHIVDEAYLGTCL